MTPSADLKRLFVVAAAAYCFTKLAFLAIFAWNTQFVMDEYYQGGLSILIHDFYHTVDPLKPLLFVYFYQLARILSDNSVELMHFARLQSLALAIGMVGMVFYISRNLSRQHWERLLAGSVLLSFSTFMERSFRVRSDTVAAFIALLALGVATSPNGRSPQMRAVAGVLLGLAFLSTQKSIYYLAAFGIGLVAVSFQERSWGRLAKESGALLAGWILALVGYSILVGGGGFLRILVHTFSSPVDLVLHAGNYYEGLRQFVIQEMERNQLAFAIALAGLLLGLRRFNHQSPSRRFALGTTLTMTILILTHNQPWPYVFIHLMPMLALWVPELLDLLPSERQIRVAAALCLLVMLGLSFARNTRYLRYDNLHQSEAVRRAESLLEPEDRYGDGIGMVATRRPGSLEWWWDAMTLARIREGAEGGVSPEIEAIFRDQPKLWIYNYRVRSLWPLLGPRLTGSYIRVYPNILLTGVEIIPGEERRFDNFWAGEYELYGADGRSLETPLLVDGRSVRGRVSLDVGVHRLEVPSVESPSRILFLPAGLSFHGELPSRAEPLHLFVNNYS